MIRKSFFGAFRTPVRLTRGSRRLFSTKPGEPSPEAAEKARSRIDRVFARLPRFLHKYTDPLRSAPITHITSFLLLHELTAIVPIIGLAATFHYANYLPPYISEGKYVSEGIEKFGNYFRKKGWLGELGEDGKKGFRGRWWGRGEGGVRVVVEVATAYAITKALLPVRLIFSVWATPWFARVAIVPFTNIFRRLFRRTGKKGTASGAARTGATGGGAVAGGLKNNPKVTSSNAAGNRNDIGPRGPS